MRKTLLYSALILALLLGSCGFNSTINKTRDVTFKSNAELIQFIEARDWVFIPERIAYPPSNEPMATSGFVVSVKGDSIRSFLPYIGRNDKPIYRTGMSPMNFSNQLLAYNIKDLGKEKGVKLYMEAVNEYNALMKMTCTLYDDGTVMIESISQYTDRITYRGHLSYYVGQSMPIEYPIL